MQKKENFQLKLSIEAWNKELMKENEELKKIILELNKKLSNYELRVSEDNLEELKAKLKLSDTFTKKVIIDYLDLDTFNLVKNIANTVNDNNSANVINFMNWWIARNTALRTILENSIDKRKEFYDKITWENKSKK